MICNTCLLPDTKPDLWFRDGVCAACWNFEARANVDWDSRAKEFTDLLEKHKGKVIVPVSGGKDSFAITLKLRELGVRPLLVNARTCSLSRIGRNNLEAISSLGADIIEVAPDRNTRRELNRYCLREVGDISWPEHVGIFTIPVRMAKALGYTLIVWGENPQNEYGGPELESNEKNNGREWLEEFGGLLGLRVSELPISPEARAIYEYPRDAEGIEGAYLGYYFPWDGLANAKLAEKHGFRWNPEPVESSGFRYENLDNYQTGIHDYFKFLKYGFGRAVDMASIRIRHGYSSRHNGLSHILHWDGKYPKRYLRRELVDILDEIGMGVTEFNSICKEFTTLNLFDGTFPELRSKHYSCEENHRDHAG